MKKLEDIRFALGQATESMGWAQFVEFIQDNDNLKGYIFRGQERASWQLTSTLYREFWKRGVHSAPDQEKVNRQLKWFRLCIRGRITLQEREATSDNEIWAIGQHHGLATVLLDWTTSPLVAAFFAFDPVRVIRISESPDVAVLNDEFDRAKKNSGEPRAVFALNARRINEVFYEAVLKELGPARTAKLDKLRPLGEKDDPQMGSFFPEKIADRLFAADEGTTAECCWAIDCAECDVARIISPLSGENRRLISQRGIFTKMLRWQPLEHWVAEYFSEAPGGKHRSDEPILLKIEIPQSDWQIALNYLEAANINHLTLFPDLEGAARFSNRKIRS